MGSLVFIDVDGTLINEAQDVPPSARDACQAAAANGHSLIMCTGRCIPELYPSLWELGFNGLVATNGSYGVIDGTVLFDHRLSAAEISRLTEFLKAEDADWMWQTPDALYPTQGFIEAFEESGTDSASAVVGQWRTYVDRVRPFIRQGDPTSASKLAFSLPVTSQYSAETMTELFTHDFVIVPGSVGAGNRRAYELVGRGITKGAGLREVAQQVNVPVKKTVAIGDSANDVPMLEAAGLSIAMGNGTRGAQEAADWVTRSVDEGGLARALEYAELI